MLAPRLPFRFRFASRPTVPSRDLRPELDAMPADTRRLVRTVGMLLAAGALLLAFAAAAQTAAYGPRTETGGILPWVFAAFVGVAVLGIFVLILSLVRTPSRRPGSHLPGTARDR